MADDSIPIWQVIEEFKDKIKTQEADLKKRREDLDILESKLRSDERELSEKDVLLGAKEEELKKREKELVPREHKAAKLHEELTLLQSELQSKEDDIHSGRENLDKRQEEISKQEAELLRLTELTTGYERRLRDSGDRISKVEERLLGEEADLKKMVETLTAKREELLAKIKVVEEQSDLLGNSKKIVLEEQKRFVEWERTLGEREKALTHRESVDKRRATSPPVHVVAPEPAFEPVKKEDLIEENNAAKMEANVEEDAPPMRSIPAPMEEPVPEPEASAEVEEIKEDQVAEPVEEEKHEFECPNCGTTIDSKSERCWACDAKLKDGKLVEAPKKKEAHRPEPKKEEPAPEPREEPVAEEKHEEPEEKHEEPEEEKKSEVKRSVSIRKIIKRK